MTHASFQSNVGSHPQLVFFKAPKDGKLFVQNSRNDRFEVKEEDLGSNSWKEWEAVLTGTRNPQIMAQYSRVVGYYSNIVNWNASKISELKDRHKGSYVLPEGNA